MSQNDSEQKTPPSSPVLRILMYLAVGAALATPVGMLLGLIQDFGFNNTVATIKLNPQTFADQYARGIVRSGWVSAVAIAICVGTFGVEWIRKRLAVIKADSQM